jgi:hypothetical protein
MRDMINYDRQYVFHRQELPLCPLPVLGGGGRNWSVYRKTSRNPPIHLLIRREGGGQKRARPGSLYSELYRLYILISACSTTQQRDSPHWELLGRRGSP